MTIGMLDGKSRFTKRLKGNGGGGRGIILVTATV